MLGDTILPRLEAGEHGADAVGMFLLRDNTYALREDDPLGQRLADAAAEREVLLTLCDRCAASRGLAAFDRTDEHGRDRYEPTNTVEGATVGCFPDPYTAPGEVGVDHGVTL